MAPSASTRRGTLPAAPVTLVARDWEQREIVRLLVEDQTRLLSLVGPPGTGKTRLALMAAVELALTFSDGIVFVDLSALRDPSLVPSAIGSALGMREATDARVAERVKTVLQKRHLLLLLDNFEHLLPAAPLVADLVAACPRLSVMATSREALHLTVERRFSVGPLPVPTVHDEAEPHLLERVPSVALFCLRARAVESGWRLDAANRHAVGELCRRLDGLPLAIELAAAWIGVLSPRALLTRLTECLNAEVAHASDQPERHRTLRAAIGWSYDLLGDDERGLFDRLAVFNDGWDQEAAAALGGTTVEAVLPLLVSLTEKHLIWSAEQPADGEPRFGLLDTLRAFGTARLESSERPKDTCGRHAQHYLMLAERAEGALIGPDQRTWLDRLERELGNLRTALRWAIDTGDAVLALRLAGALWFFWDMRGHLREGQRWLEDALNMPAPAGSASLRAWALNAAGWLALVQHASYGPAIALLDEARATAEGIEDQPALVRAQAFLGLTLALGTREHERAEEILEHAVSGARAVGDTWALALALYGQGHVALLQGHADRGQERWQTCAAVVQRVGNLYGLSYLQFRWGVLALLSQDLDRANACLRESLRLSAELDSIREMAVAIAALVLVAAAGGQAERAARLAGAMQALLDRAGCDLPAFLGGEYERGLARLHEHLSSAAFNWSFVAGRALSARDILAEAFGDTSSASHLPEQVTAGASPEYAPLSAREWEVARLVARGCRNREIAERLVLTQRTIGSHLERIFARLHIRSRAQLAAWTAARDGSSPTTQPEVAAATPGEPRARQPAPRSARRLRVVGE